MNSKELSEQPALAVFEFISKDEPVAERVPRTKFHIEPDAFEPLTRLDDISSLVDQPGDGAALPPLEVTSLWTNDGMSNGHLGSGIGEQKEQSGDSCIKCHDSEIVGTICHTFCGACRRDPDNDDDW